MEIKREFGRLRWQSNKATVPRTRRVPEGVLAESIECHRRGAFEDSVTALESQPPEVRDQDPDALVVLALSRFGADDYEGALKELSKANRVLDEMRAKVQVNRANILKVLGRFTEALEAASMAKRLMPRHFAPYLSLIAIHECRGTSLDRDESRALLHEIKANGVAALWRDQLRSYLEADADYDGLRRNEPEVLRELLMEG